MVRLQEALDEEVKKGRDVEFLLEEAKMEAEGWERETRALRKRVDEAEVKSGDKIMSLISQVDDMHAKVIIDNFGVEVCTIQFENPAFLSRVATLEDFSALRAHLTK
jgi:hypothetical protein